MAQRTKLGFVTLLTTARFPLVLSFFTCALLYTRSARPWIFALSLLLLIVAAVTDLLDGYFARRFSVETKLGEHMDPLMDKFFYLSTMPLLVFVSAQNGHGRHAVFLLVLTLLFLSRDQWVTFLRAIGSMYHVGGGAHWSGKLRTAVNFPLICVIYYTEEAPWRMTAPVLLYALETIALGVNILSAVIYTRRYWPCLLRAASPDGASARGGDA